MMQAYRKKLKFETGFLIFACLLLLAVQVLAFCRVIRPLAGPHWADFWNGMLAGAGFGLTVLFLVGIIVNLRALRNQERLKKLYVKESDERTAQIVRASQSAGYRMGVSLMLVAGFVAGYYNVGISLACLACAFGQSVITCLAKLYYHQTM